MHDKLTRLGNGTDSIPSSPHHRPADIKSPEFVLPQIPRFTESPHSSAPSTPVDDNGARGHRRTDSVTIEGEDYFMSVARFAASDAKSLPGTPRSMVRNISFSPRIQFHDTWPSGEYDRRGEIATCNRLTPTLAQAIKEELNTFKMVQYFSHILHFVQCILTSWIGDGSTRTIQSVHSLLLKLQRRLVLTHKPFLPHVGDSRLRTDLMTLFL